MNKVFQIGFNKCGTRSLCHLFSQSQIPTIHWYNHKGILPKLMLANFFAGRHLIPSQYEKYTFFSDLEHVYQNDYIPIHSYLFYRTLCQNYPSAKFILNIRPIDNWVNSRVNHDNGKYLSRFQSMLNFNKEDTISYWRDHFNNHIKNVKQYFKDKPNKLIVFDIENDNINKLINFFPEFDLKNDNWIQIKG